jgi:hypothetical protein
MNVAKRTPLIHLAPADTVYTVIKMQKGTWTKIRNILFLLLSIIIIFKVSGKGMQMESYCIVPRRQMYSGSLF